MKTATIIIVFLGIKEAMDKIGVMSSPIIVAVFCYLIIVIRQLKFDLCHWHPVLNYEINYSGNPVFLANGFLN